MIVLNGGSSSGKSSLARSLQAVLPDAWLTFGVDDFVDALPAALQDSDAGIEFAPDGGVSVGPAFRALEAAWVTGVAAMARAGAHVIVDEVFLGGPDSQRRWREALGDLPVLWVGVRCEPATAAAREAARGDRTTGMAALQAELVHRGVVYDLEVDTTRADPAACARTVAAHAQGERGVSGSFKKGAPAAASVVAMNGIAKESRHLSVRIARPAGEVYAYAADPANLPAWAHGLSGSISPSGTGEEWVAESPMGRVTVTFTPRNPLGVLDHDVTLPTGETVHNPVRVLPDGPASEVVFTIRHLPAMTDEEFDRDAATVAADLDRLKHVLEAAPPGGV
ncbi:Chloramphenicol 3-O-phosphotransferase [Actinacidiphila paucisporea]|uniref:Chloramphenicol 3-O-phosphotransferase n=2 Tax=Actinacidiphila paucisporea TaxID=310782 RepID=A0A1M6TRA8_9ACTN|nr:Chloramphenicol 3-O-phosphotransferase [Actinacidiphila paucisporea]